MSFLNSFRVATEDWQGWLDGKVALDAGNGSLVSLDECAAAHEQQRAYWSSWGADDETTDCWLAYHSGMCRRSDMCEVEEVDRADWYDRTSTGMATRYELRENPGNALTLVACDMGDGTTEVWHDGYGV